MKHQQRLLESLLEHNLIRPLQILFSRRKHTSLSGRSTKLCGYLRAFGQQKFIVLGLEEDGQPRYALDELEGMSIRCAFCTRPIFVEDQVTVFTRSEYGTLHPYDAVQQWISPEEWIGCSREECGNKGKIEGYWGPSEFHFGKGRLHRFLYLTKPIHHKTFGQPRLGFLS